MKENTPALHLTLMERPSVPCTSHQRPRSRLRRAGPDTSCTRASRDTINSCWQQNNNNNNKSHNNNNNNLSNLSNNRVVLACLSPSNNLHLLSSNLPCSRVHHLPCSNLSSNLLLASSNHPPASSNLPPASSNLPACSNPAAPASNSNSKSRCLEANNNNRC